MNDVAGITSTLIREVASKRDPARFRQWVRTQRLEPLLYGLELDGVELGEAFLEECRAAYFNMIGRSQLFLHESDRLTQILSSAGIEAVAWRGVIYGRDLYQDPALRYCTDIDLIAPRDQRWMALDVLSRNGYHLRSRLVPRWYLARHHLHWPLMRNDGRIPVDLHWAVDHPYRQNAAETRNMTGLTRPAMRLAAAVIHAEKESRLRYAATMAEMEYRLLEDGPILPWLDLALMIKQADAAALREFIEWMNAISRSRELNRALWIVRTYFDVSIEEYAYQDLVFVGEPRGFRNWVVSRKFVGAIAEAIGCRPEALMDWVDYLVPGDHGAVTGFARRCGRVMLLLMDSILCGVWMLVLKCGGRSNRVATG